MLCQLHVLCLYIITYTVHISRLAFMNCVTWATVLLGVQDELGPAKWHCYSSGSDS